MKESTLSPAYYTTYINSVNSQICIKQNTTETNEIFQYPVVNITYSSDILKKILADHNKPFYWFIDGDINVLHEFKNIIEKEFSKESIDVDIVEFNNFNSESLNDVQTLYKERVKITERLQSIIYNHKKHTIIFGSPLMYYRMLTDSLLFDEIKSNKELYDFFVFIIGLCTDMFGTAYRSNSSFIYIQDTHIVSSILTNSDCMQQELLYALRNSIGSNYYFMQHYFQTPKYNDNTQNELYWFMLINLLNIPLI